MKAFDSVFISAIVGCVICILQIMATARRQGDNDNKESGTIWKKALVVLVCLIIFLCVLAFLCRWESDILGVSKEETNPTYSSNLLTENVGGLKSSDSISISNETTKIISADIPIISTVGVDEDNSYNKKFIIESKNNYCEKEMHNRVKNEVELNGFVFWGGAEGFEKMYFNAIDNNLTIGGDTEPLHHVCLDLSNGGFSGMAISISLYGYDTGLGIMLDYDDNLLEFYISEGHFTISAEIWDGEFTRPYAEMDVVIDHCGDYYLPFTNNP